ncbi:transketolase [Streptomyces zhihengii]
MQSPPQTAPEQPTRRAEDTFRRPAQWTALDRRAVDVARALAMDAVQHAGHGHPGTAMSLAPVAHVLFQKVMRHDPADPGWAGRDRFVLSAGHASALLYVQLMLAGYPLSLDDLKEFRRRGSRTPGHPEHGHTPGVETTTGPLGQGVANAVGMAMAARYERGLFDPDAPDGASVFDHTVWVVAGDGDLQEGVCAEASSLAGHQKLGNLVVLWDDNHISIEGDTATAISEDVEQRYAAYGWHVQRVEPGPDGDLDPVALHDALLAAQRERGRPSLIAARSVIAWPAPRARGTAAAHGAPLGDGEVAATKTLLGLDAGLTFHVPDEVLAHTRTALDRGRAERTAWNARFAHWQHSHPARAAEYERITRAQLPAGWENKLPSFEPGTTVATRAASGAVLAALGPLLPELWGGSADLAGSNNTTIDPASSFLPAGNPLPQADPYGRTVHFGIREHAMASVMNGVVLHGSTHVYGGTFLVFSDYMRPAVRLAALMRLPVTYVWTHDSIGLGEDGPTHQPVEHLASLRAIPGLNVVRPADANETATAWAEILRRRRTDPAPHGLVLSRQGLPVLAPDARAARGGYVLREAEGGAPRALLVATGSEVALAIAAQELLQERGIPTRVVSLPCLEWFMEQDRSYRDEVLPPGVRARVTVEAGIGLGWERIAGEAGGVISLERFGASADGALLFREFGFTPEAIAAEAENAVARAARR